MLYAFFWLGFLQYATGQGCSQQSISIETKVAYIVADNDHNKDNKVTVDDIKHDNVNNYDTDHDGIVTERECVRRWTCRYGDTRYVATYICMKIQGGKEAEPEDASDIPFFQNGVWVADFAQNNRDRYTEFSNKSCVNRYLTVDEKVELNADDNDYNDDGDVDAGDFLHDIINNYDRDGDGNVTEEEWVLHWVCAYGDDGYFARHTWQVFTGGLPIIPNRFFAGSTTNTIDQHKVRTKQMYESYAKEQEKENKAECPGTNAGHTLTGTGHSVIALLAVLFGFFWHNS